MKKCYPPLFPPGFHDIAIADIHSLFVAPFRDNSRRTMLSKKLMEYIDDLQSVLQPHGVAGELWIDGSFGTEKIHPDDVDLIVFIPGADLNSLPPHSQQRLQGLLNTSYAKVNYSCDAYFCVTEDQPQRSYWRGWFMFDRDEQPKGIARVTI
ncbi:DUF6932 family protein [Marinobacterium stanieri]|uniref:Nucleotidyltransferase domain-containing protein n=1 Tax=Marinobacterium stanieri TaxID=49186 RepID=A0A1N6QBV8_9GAMM|nr:hypothetical protein [Marinobacterium stanieri]SIQ14053.1 hypothetical protein SAMN05421647_102404 [Marinobacterium stanieri]